MDERRQLPRWEIKKEAKVYFPQTQDFSLCVIEDMHLKGMCVSTIQELPKQEPLRLSFAIGESSEFIKVEAQVPWQKEEQGRHVYGLSFIRIDDPDKEKLYQYVSTNCFDQFRNNWWA